MSAPTMAERIAEIRRENQRDRSADDLFGSELVDLVMPGSAHVRDLLAAIDHVTETLREAQRNNGGYGFVRGLLEYLGATEEVPA